MSYYPPPGYGAPGGYGQPAQPPPSNHLVWAILTTIFCCLPAGVVAIIFAAQVNSKWATGDYAGAMSSANNAKIWSIVSAVGGLLIAAIYIVLLVAGVMSADNSPSTY
ncbi:CD225/dispanin family protein [Actinomadura parmotrematis]|uniref:CD225/dispanin family protein n=1 Tax=Actinomadura parmotrematis TaxID=2864039 RepID=A0ABS7G7D7_9ACTN|nr:CD225/dispanin family protein [Actinomadura parmotrematis]MBW8487538.1 CD225/dispanin family protein [Actinomadura parmotrematis]